MTRLLFSCFIKSEYRATFSIFRVDRFIMVTLWPGRPNQMSQGRGVPTTSHCGHSTTVIITVSNPRTRATIQSVMFIQKETPSGPISKSHVQALTENFGSSEIALNTSSNVHSHVFAACMRLHKERRVLRMFIFVRSKANRPDEVSLFPIQRNSSCCQRAC